MTTIALKNGILAADTLATMLDETNKVIEKHYVRKLLKLPNGTLVAYTGSWQSVLNALVSWCAGILCKPFDEGDTEGLAINPEGIPMYVFNHEVVGDIVPEKAAKGIALGSGAPYATVAMRVGFSARMAVKIASLFDPCTGGDVMYDSIDPPTGQALDFKKVVAEKLRESHARQV